MHSYNTTQYSYIATTYNIANYIQHNVNNNYTTTQYVTEHWKTDHVHTFGQLLFIGPTNSHTHTLPVHCCINGLS